MKAMIYHNPACGTSRNTLAILRASGEEPVVAQIVADGVVLLGSLPQATVGVA